MYSHIFAIEIPNPKVYLSIYFSIIELWSLERLGPYSLRALRKLQGLSGLGALYIHHNQIQDQVKIMHMP